MASAVRMRVRDARRERRQKQRRSCTVKTPPHQPTDTQNVATPEDLEQIRTQLNAIKRMLAQIFGRAYDGGRVSRQARRRAADLIETNFDEIVEQWTSAVEQMLRPTSERP